MNNKDDSFSAFPLPLGDEQINERSAGMSLRDYFAASSLQGLLASCPHDAKTREAMSGEIWALAAYKMADCMLAERAK